MHPFAQGKKPKVKTIDEIVARTKEEIEKRKQKVPLEELKASIERQPARHFMQAIQFPKKGSVAIIAEVKLASPSESNLGTADDISTRVKMYEQAGADCISVVTEKHFFRGDSEFVRLIKNTISLPVLQKDFILDPYQLHESKKAGDDAILLIARIVSKDDLISLVKTAQTIGLEVVVEANSKDGLEKALSTETKIVAVNARDLDTFNVDVDRACKLLKLIPDTFIKLGFSGVIDKTQVEKYKNAGADGVLIGTSLMKTDNIKNFLLLLQAK